MNESLAGFFDTLTGELQRLLSADQTEPVTVQWNRVSSDVLSSNIAWWHCALSVDPAFRVYAGIERETGADEPQETWFAALTSSVEHAAKAKFGALVSCQDLGTAEAPPEGTRIPVAIMRGERSSPAMLLVLSPDLAAELGSRGQEREPGPAEADLNVAVEAGRPAESNALDILQHVEIPVSVSFGRTHMRLKDLLSLSNGSVVQLDRELGDEVELRANNCVIARGEVVAVEGNYGIRILKMTPGALRT